MMMMMMIVAGNGDCSRQCGRGLTLHGFKVWKRLAALKKVKVVLYSIYALEPDPTLISSHLVTKVTVKNPAIGCFTFSRGRYYRSSSRASPIHHTLASAVLYRFFADMHVFEQLAQFSDGKLPCSVFWMKDELARELMCGWHCSNSCDRSTLQ